jgi:two-component system cell cycle response regulator DivK
MNTRQDKPNVLVVDDYGPGREMYAIYLQHVGFRVSEASDGVEAVERARELQPDLVVMDLSLPRKDGWSAMKTIREDPLTKHIPVILLTGHVLQGTADQALRAGCDAFLAKPCFPDALAAEIRRVLAARMTSCS